jgi:hypothetical protein
MSAIASFLYGIADEAAQRGYTFDVRKIVAPRSAEKIRETRGQLDYEWAHLKRKLKVRAPVMARRLRGVAKAQAHPLFRIVAGKVRDWEKQPESGAKTNQPSAGEPRPAAGRHRLRRKGAAKGSRHFRG